MGALGSIRALHGVAEIAEYLGDAAHADAADPDEVNRSDLARQSHGRFLAPSSSGKRGRSSNREALEQNQLRGVLDAPLSRGVTRVFSVITGRQIPATFITRSASRCAASSLPTLRAAAAMAVSRSGSAASAEISAASRSGVNSACGIRSAPFACARMPALAN